ncbi:MAG TPA: hypothetical protein VF757_08280 [Sphingomicrobium sp.]
MRRQALAFALLALLPGCKTSSVTAPVKSAGETVVSGAKAVGSAATSLVNVNLSNVLNNLAVDLHVDRANIPINAMIPITIAANVCGVSINILSVAAANTAKCTATTTSPQLTQIVGQQLQAGGGTQTGAAPATTTTATQPPPATTTPPK